MPLDSLVVNEIFFSIQGESVFAGEPCVFVRLAHCDLRCKWCDTEYAFDKGRKLSIEEILGQVLAYPTQLVEITGGEPLLQKGVYTLIGRLLAVDKRVLIETGGHRDISQVDHRATLIYDIKCPDSGMSHRNRWENLSLLRAHDQIKFVLASRRDYDWAKEKIKSHQLTPNYTVLLSPVWDTLPPDRLASWILEDGLQVRIQLQLHKILWGPDARGV
jgi:7-carboxy-7-deazaguanine synthase